MGKYSSTAGKVEWHRRLQSLHGVLETHIHTHRWPLYEAHERRAIRPTDSVFIIIIIRWAKRNSERGKTQNSRRGGWRKAMSVAVLPQTICVCSLVNKYSNMLLVYAADFIYLRTEKRKKEKGKRRTTS